jgi:hypothetical protein
LKRCEGGVIKSSEDEGGRIGSLRGRAATAQMPPVPEQGPGGCHRSTSRALRATASLAWQLHSRRDPPTSAGKNREKGGRRCGSADDAASILFVSRFGVHTAGPCLLVLVHPDWFVSPFRKKELEDAVAIFVTCCGLLVVEGEGRVRV